jgi:hypothetical protein
MSKKVSKTRAKKPSKLAQTIGINEFEQYLTSEAERTGKSRQRIVEETFRDGFLTWTFEDTEQIVGGKKHVTESAVSSAQAPPILTAWAMPNVAEDINELRRLRREFGPVSRAVDYIKGMILGNELDVEITDPEDKTKKEIRDEIKRLMKDIYQDEYTRSLYTLLSIMLDETLTVGVAGSEIRYENSVKFMDYVDQVMKSTLPVAKSTSGGSGKEFVYYKSHEPVWDNLGGIVQLKIFKNANGRLKLYRDPETWEANYWTLDEIVSQGDTTMAMSQLALKPASGQVLKFHPWQLFWLSVNRREFDEHGMSVITPVKNTALLLEKILSAVGEGCFRAGNKKYFIVCGTEKRPWSKPHIRNVMQQINEMGKRNWTTVPVPYGFDIKEIGGTVFQATQVINTLINLIGQGMHVPTEIIGVVTKAMGTSTGEREMSVSFNEIEQMRYEFKQAIQNQLFRRQLWCTYGKTRTKQGGKGVEPIYVPDVKCSTKGLLSPIDKLGEIIKLLNVANPVSPQIKLELEREMARIMAYDNIDFETQEELKKELDARVGTSSSIANPLMGKTQGQPEPQTKERQQARQEGGVNVKKAESGKSKSMGGTRIPKESKMGVKETYWNRELEDHDYKVRRFQMVKEGMNHELIDETFIQETQPQEIQETPLTQEPSQKPQGITPTAEYKDQSSQKTGGNYGPYGYYKVMEIPNISKEGDTFPIPSPIIDQQITVEIQKLSDAVARYNKDLTKIYVDPSLPIETYKPVLSREIFEYQLEQNLGQGYEKAERMANLYEKIVCEELDIDWDEHQKAFEKAMGVVNARKNIKNPDDVVEHSKKTRKPRATKTKPNVEEIASEGRSSMRSETGDKEAKVGGPPAGRMDTQYAQESKTIDVNINVKTEATDKALAELNEKLDATTEKYEKLSQEILLKHQKMNEQTAKLQEDIAAKERDKITAEVTKTNMEIVNLEAERQKIEAEHKAIEESAKEKKDVLDEIKKKVKGEE